MKETKHKCRACGKVRLRRYMMPDTVSETQKGKQKVKWVCGNCEEENRGRKIKTPSTGSGDSI